MGVSALRDRLNIDRVVSRVGLNRQENTVRQEKVRHEEERERGLRGTQIHICIKTVQKCTMSS